MWSLFNFCKRGKLDSKICGRGRLWSHSPLRNEWKKAYFRWIIYIYILERISTFYHIFYWLLYLDTITAIKLMTVKNMYRKLFIWFIFSYCSPWLKWWTHDRNGKKARTWRQELIYKPWRGATYLLFHHGSTFFLLKPRTTSLGYQHPQ